MFLLGTPFQPVPNRHSGGRKIHSLPQDFTHRRHALLEQINSCIMGSGIGRTIKGDKWALKMSPGPGIVRASSWERPGSLLGSLHMATGTPPELCCFCWPEPRAGGGPPPAARPPASCLLWASLGTGGRCLLLSLMASSSPHLKADSCVFPLEMAAGEDALFLCDGEYHVHYQCHCGGHHWLSFPGCLVALPGLCGPEEDFSVWGGGGKGGVWR